MSKYFVPENCEQYHKFDYDPRFMLGPFRDESKFLEFLDLNRPGSVPDNVPDVPSRGKGSFLELANKLAQFIQHQSEHYLSLYLGFLFLTDI